MSNQETEKPGKPKEGWVDMDAVLRIVSEGEDKKLLEVWKRRRDDAKKKKPKFPNRPSQG